MMHNMIERVSFVMFGAAMRVAAPMVRVLPLPQPMLLVGPGGSQRMASLIGGWGHSNWLLVVDPAVAGLPVMKDVVALLTQLRFTKSKRAWLFSMRRVAMRCWQLVVVRSSMRPRRSPCL